MTHIACPYCEEMPETSSQDVRLAFTSGRYYQFPDTLLAHYFLEHSFRPPDEFLVDVVRGIMLDQLPSGREPFCLGYSDDEVWLPWEGADNGDVLQFLRCLAGLIRRARCLGMVGGG